MAVDKRRALHHAGPVDIGAAIAAVRIDAGLTQTELAEKIGVEQKTLSRLELGQQRPYLDQVISVDLACGRPPGTVLRSASVIEDPDDVEKAIAADPKLDRSARQALLVLYRGSVTGQARRR